MPCEYALLVVYLLPPPPIIDESLDEVRDAVAHTTEREGEV